MSSMPLAPQAYPMPPGIPPYPGIPAINNLPIMQYGPSFDGLFDHGLSTNPFINSLFEDVNAFQDGLFKGSGTGFSPLGGPPFPGVFPPPMGPAPGGNNPGGAASGGDHGAGSTH